jgi:hypothetical protein
MTTPITSVALSAILCLCLLQEPRDKIDPSPLAAYSTEWNDLMYLKCNTAANVTYMNAQEKELIYVLNLLRMNPALFGRTVVAKYPERSGQLHLRDIEEYQSLLDTLQKLKSLPLLDPDSLSFVSARCHAISSGRTGYVGHTRQSKDCKPHYHGECCSYGHSDPLDIIMSLLIDEGVPSLGHRFICLATFRKIGVSIQPHKGYGYNTVLDFYD